MEPVSYTHLCGLRFRISSKSFYQVNSAQTELLYNKALQLAGLTGKEKALDAYCGIGTIGLIASRKAGEVIGVELNPDAVRDAVQNAKMNDVKTVSYTHLDGILAGPYLDQEKMYVKILNPDGSEVPKSGNGMGIFAKYLKDAGYVQKTSVSWMTISGEENVFYLNEEGTRVKISMGRPSFWSDEIPVTGERREMVNQTMMFGKIPYVTTVSYTHLLCEGGSQNCGN